MMRLFAVTPVQELIEKGTLPREHVGTHRYDKLSHMVASPNTPSVERLSMVGRFPDMYTTYTRYLRNKADDIFIRARDVEPPSVAFHIVADVTFSLEKARQPRDINFFHRFSRFTSREDCNPPPTSRHVFHASRDVKR